MKFTKLNLDKEVMDYIKGSLRRAESRNWIVHLYHAQSDCINKVFYIVASICLIASTTVLLTGQHQEVVCGVALSLMTSVYILKEVVRMSFKRVKKDQQSMLNLELRRDKEFYKERIYPLLKQHSFYAVYRSAVDSMHDDDVMFVKESCALDRKLNAEDKV